jgi:hypothetical protein
MLSAVDEKPKLAHSEMPAASLGARMERGRNGKQPTGTSGPNALNSRDGPRSFVNQSYC